MARKILVVSSYGSELTGERLKKSVAEMVVRRLLADWVVKGVSIRRRKVCEVNLVAIPAQRDTTPRTYVPITLPPAEVGGCKFIPPVSDPRPSFASVREGWDWSREQIPA